MSKKDKSSRAQLFQPFDALKGFREALREKEKLVSEKKILSEEESEQINFLIKNIKKGYLIKVTYFQDNNYTELTGVVSKIDFHNQSLKISNTNINFSTMIALEVNNSEKK